MEFIANLADSIGLSQNRTQTAGGLLMGSPLLKSLQPRPETKDMNPVEKYKFEKAFNMVKQMGTPVTRQDMRKALDEARLFKRDPKRWEMSHGHELDFPNILETGMVDEGEGLEADGEYLDPAYWDDSDLYENEEKDENEKKDEKDKNEEKRQGGAKKRSREKRSRKRTLRNQKLNKKRSTKSQKRSKKSKSLKSLKSSRRSKRRSRH